LIAVRSNINTARPRYRSNSHYTPPTATAAITNTNPPPPTATTAKVAGDDVVVAAVGGGGVLVTWMTRQSTHHVLRCINATVMRLER